MKQLVMKTTLLLVMILFFSSLASAQTIGINKAEMTFTDVLAGGYAQETILITTSNEEPKKVTINKYGNAVDWLTIEPDNKDFFTSRKKPLRVIITFEPPHDAGTNSYRGELQLLLTPTTQEKTAYATTAQPALRIPVRATTTNQERTTCVVAGITVQSIEQGQPLTIQYTIKNNGNTRTTPDMKATLYDARQENVLREEIITTNQVLPTKKEQITNTMSSPEATGQYWLRLESNTCALNHVTTFDVLLPGTTADRGELTTLLVRENVQGETTTILASFRNRGANPVRAQLDATITHLSTGRVQEVRSEQVLVNPTNNQQLQTYFVPQRAGDYEIIARVTYNEKVTQQEQRIIRIEEKEKKFFTITLPSKELVTPIILFTTIITLLLLLIHKKKKVIKKARTKSVRKQKK